MHMRKYLNLMMSWPLLPQLAAYILHLQGREGESNITAGAVFLQAILGRADEFEALHIRLLLDCLYQDS